MMTSNSTAAPIETTLLEMLQIPEFSRTTLLLETQSWYVSPYLLCAFWRRKLWEQFGYRESPLSSTSVISLLVVRRVHVTHFLFLTQARSIAVITRWPPWGLAIRQAAREQEADLLATPIFHYPGYQLLLAHMTVDHPSLAVSPLYNLSIVLQIV